MIVEDLYISAAMFEVIQPLLVTLRLFGLLPISYKKFGYQYRLKWSVIFGIYSYVLCIGLTLWMVFTLITEVRKPLVVSFRMTDEKTKFVTIVDISIVVLIVAYGIFTLHLRIKKFWKFMQFLNQTEQIIQLKSPKCYRKMSVCFIATVTSISFLLFSYDLLSWFEQLKGIRKYPEGYIKYYFAFYLLYSIMIMKELFYWHIIFLLKIRISLLSKELTKIKDRINKNGLRKFFGIKQLDNLSENIRGESSNKKINSTSAICDKNDNTSETGKQLILYSMYQENILEAAELVNSSMEFCIPLIMLSCLLHLIVTPYFLLKNIVDNIDYSYLTLQSVWLLGHIGRLLIIVEPCQSCINEHHKILNIISEILTYEVDDNIKKGMTILSLQFSRWKLKFSACGFFKLNRSLLTSIAGAVTTYLVILFQFNA